MVFLYIKYSTFLKRNPSHFKSSFSRQKSKIYVITPYISTFRQRISTKLQHTKIITYLLIKAHNEQRMSPLQIMSFHFLYSIFPGELSIDRFKNFANCPRVTSISGSNLPSPVPTTTLLDCNALIASLAQ